MAASSSAVTIATYLRKDKTGTVRPVRRIGAFSSSTPFIQDVQERIGRDFRRGVSERALSTMYRCKREVIEGVIRDLWNASLAAGRAAAATACLLVGISVGEVWQASQGQQGAMVRVFRGRIAGRKRQEDGGAYEAVEHSRAHALTGTAAEACFQVAA